MLLNEKENMDNPKISIIILNLNDWENTIECLESIYQITYPNYEVIVVDNGSKDCSIDKIKEYTEGMINVESKFFKFNTNNKPIKVVEYNEEEVRTSRGQTEEINSLPSNKKAILIKNKKNYGYTGGNNIGIKYALTNSKTDYFLILNNDIVVAPDFLSEMIEVAESDLIIGIAGPKTFFYDDPQRFQLVWIDVNLIYGQGKNNGFREIDHGQFDQINKECNIVQGSCLLVRKEVIERIGLLDEDYFCYYDEMDYCLRTRKAGYKIAYVPKAKVWHKISQTSQKLSGFAHYYRARNTFRFMRKFANKKEYIFFLLYFFGCYLLFKIAVCLVYRRDIKQLIAFYRGVKDGLFNSSSGARHYITE